MQQETRRLQRGQRIFYVREVHSRAAQTSSDMVTHTIQRSDKFKRSYSQMLRSTEVSQKISKESYCMTYFRAPISSIVSGV